MRGRGLLEHFEAILSLHSKIEQYAKSDDGYSGSFHLGTTEMVALTWLPKLISAITARFPNINLKTSINMTHELQAKFRDYKLDLIICPKMADDDQSEHTALDLLPLESAWMCSEHFQLEQKGILSPRDIANLPLLTFNEGSLLHHTVTRTLAEHGYSARQTITCSSMIALAELVREGLGISYLPRDYFQSYGSLAIVHTSMVMRPLQYAATYRDDFIAAQIAQMAQHLCKFTRPIA